MATLLSTWSFGQVAARAAFPALAAGGSALDAVVAGASAVELDPTVDSVGVGGLPDASGRLSLDASVMTDPDRAGSVCFVRGFAHPTKIARDVMERTIHVMLAGDGAEAFARRLGHAERDQDALTDHARRLYLQWRDAHSEADAGGREGYTPPMNVEERYRRDSAADGSRAGEPLPGHDTISLLARDRAGRLAGACTTSGLAFKLPGRVGDSPIIGHGLYVDQRAGAAAGTGTGELIMGVCGSFLIVEFMRQGLDPRAAIRRTLERIAERFTLHPDHQAGFIAMAPDGRWASGALRPGFTHCISDEKGTRLEAADTLMGS